MSSDGVHPRRYGAPVAASPTPAISLRMARSRVRRQSSPSRAGLGDRGGPRAAPELVADVGHVPVHGVRADDQLLGDLAVAQSLGDQCQNLALTGRQEHARRLRVRRRPVAVAERRAHRPADRADVAQPREVRACPRAGSELAPRDRGRQLAPELGTGSRGRRDDERPTVGACTRVELGDVRRCGRRARAARRPSRRSPPPADSARTAPARRCRHRPGRSRRANANPVPSATRTVSTIACAHVRRPDRRPVGVGAVEHQPFDSLGVSTRRTRPRRNRPRSRRGALTRSQPELVEHRGEHGDLVIERQRQRRSTSRSDSPTPRRS